MKSSCITFFTFLFICFSSISIKAEETADKKIEGTLPGMEFVRIPAGSFMMGSPADEEGRYKFEGPQHRVTIRSFYMQTTEVTQRQWREVMGNNPSKWKGDNSPVESDPWNHCQSFIKKLNELYPGHGYRLPTESEWEYACRAGTTTPFNTGRTISTNQANYRGDFTYGSGRKGVFRKETVSVGSFSPNSWDLYDMHGNVWEWCEDRWHDNYYGAPSDGSAWLSGSSSSYVVLRGGGWFRSAGDCRSADRSGWHPDNGNHDTGFRLVCDR